MVHWKKISLAIFIAIVLALVGVSLYLLLDEDDIIDVTEPEPLCETSRIYFKNKHLLDVDKKPHFLKNIERSLRPPPVEVDPTKLRASAIKLAWLTQRVDHFNPVDLRTWKMRYLLNDQFYEEGGPIFIFLGGEWDIIPQSGYLLTGQLYDMAEEHNGYMFYTEHRYYGESMPTENLCTENLQYLNADQALADLAYFVEYQKQTRSTLRNSTVVVVGGSYSATLATWARIKYPHIIQAALASSAPLLAIADFYQYYEVVSANLQKASQSCVDIISEAFTDMEELLNSGEGTEKVSEDFRTCQAINTTEPQRAYFFESLTTPFAGLVQAANEGDIEEQCDLLNSFNGTSYEKFKQYINQYYEGYCLSNYEYFATYLDYPLPNGIYRQWMYQTCTEYGFYQTTNSNNQYFGKNTVNLGLYQNYCKDIYGVDIETMEMGIERTNLFYGALEPDVTRVVSVHGTVDPWHSIGVHNDINDEAPVYLVDGTAHCKDLVSLSEDDLPDLKNARIRTKEHIAEWIK